MHRNEKLTQINSLLREQLEESHTTNEAITSDLQKLTNDFDALREEMIIKEDEWKDEEQAFNDYYSAEHNRLLNLWKDVVSMKRLFIDVQTITDRDLSKLKTEISEFTRDVVTACSRIDRKSTGVESIFEVVFKVSCLSENLSPFFCRLKKNNTNKKPTKCVSDTNN